MKRQQAGDALDLRRLASRSAAALLLAGGLTTLPCALPLHGLSYWLTLAIAVLSFVASLACLLLPFHRWPRTALLPMALLSIAMVGTMNYLSYNPYDSACFFFALSVFIGLSQPRGTTVALAPVLALAFWLPLHLVAPVGHQQWIEAGTEDTVVVCVLLGEITAHLVSRLTRSAVRLHEHDERRFAGLVENSSDITILIDGQGVVDYASPSLGHLLGFDPLELLGKDYFSGIGSYLHPDDLEVVAERVRLGLAGRGEWAAQAQTSLTLRVTGTDGEQRVLECTMSGLTEGEGLVINARDITERQRLQLEIREQTLRHPMTGLPNRTLLSERLYEALSAGHQISVVYCDIDGFKTVNDRLGRAGGDAVLSEVAARLDALVSEPSLVAHLEGDEFGVLLVGAGPNETQQFAELVLDRAR